MFSGIIEEIGRIKLVKRRKNLLALSVGASKVLRSTRLGDSISVDGVCLTVTQKSRGSMSFDVMLETIEKTTLRFLCVGHRVNLERALRAGGRISGHFVSGHIDAVGTIESKTVKENFVSYQISVPSRFRKYLAPKGSICVDGISLTIGKVQGDRFEIYIIPHTLKVTTLGLKKKGDKVNIETDILAKYLHSLI